jgi:hypothetical protein
MPQITLAALEFKPHRLSQGMLLRNDRTPEMHQLQAMKSTKLRARNHYRGKLSQETAHIRTGFGFFQDFGGAGMFPRVKPKTKQNAS